MTLRGFVKRDSITVKPQEDVHLQFTDIMKYKRRSLQGVPSLLII